LSSQSFNLILSTNKDCIAMELATSSRQTINRGLWLIASASILWGTVGVTTQALYGMTNTNPLSVGFLRLALAALPLLLVSWRLLGSRAWRIPLRDLGLMAMIGAMLGIYQACFFAAIQQTGVAIATLVTLCTAPVMVAAISVGLGREQMTSTVGASLALALSGTALLVGFYPGANIPQASLIGVLFALGSGFGYAVLAVIGRQLADRYHPIQVNAVGFSVGAVILLIIALPSGLVLSYPAEGWLLLLYMGLVPSALGYWLFFTGVRTTGATAASIITLLEPLTATILAWALFGEQLAPIGLLGAVLLLSAIGLLTTKRS
jgi:drug/metabolite transporter, DME family